MPARVLYHCPCSTDFTSSYGPEIPSSSSHDLGALYFCEECDSIRCNLCTTRDLSAFYCPNCLFDVPLASVKQEKAKCPRNCFSCPICTSTLSVVSSDIGGQGSSDEQHWDPRSPEASIGEPPYILACPTCRWDSREAGLVFEKPTGLTLQLQRLEEAAADVLEYHNLRAHLDTFLRVADVPTAALAARSSKLLRDVPSLANDPHFGPNRWEQKRKGMHNAPKDEQMPPFEANMSWDNGRDKRRTKGMYTDPEEGEALGHIGRKQQSDLDEAANLHQDGPLASLAQRWAEPQDQKTFKKDLGPQRISLRAKQTKRCPACRHIIIRPDTKPSSHRFKIKLMALQHLPEVQIHLPPAGAAFARDDRRSRPSVLSATLSRRRPAIVDTEMLQAGRTYLYEARITNPLDDAISVKLHIASPSFAADSATDDGNRQDSVSRSWTVTPTASSFPVSAFNAVWELEEDNDEDDDLCGVSKGDSLGNDGDDRQGWQNRKGVLRKRGHETVVGLELRLGTDAEGDIEFPMQITFSHRIDAEKSATTTAARDGGQRTFSFWTFVRLGCVSRDVDSGYGGVRRLASAMMIPESDGERQRVTHEVQSSSSLNATLTTEQRRQMLDKKRSIMGLRDATASSASTS